MQSGVHFMRMIFGVEVLWSSILNFLLCFHYFSSYFYHFLLLKPDCLFRPLIIELFMFFANLSQTSDLTIDINFDSIREVFFAIVDDFILTLIDFVTLHKLVSFITGLWLLILLRLVTSRLIVIELMFTGGYPTSH